MSKSALALILLVAAYLLSMAPWPLLICCLLSGLWVVAVFSLHRYLPGLTENLIYLLTLCLLVTAVCAGMTLSSPWWWIMALLTGSAAFIIPSYLLMRFGFSSDTVVINTAEFTAAGDEPSARKPEKTPEGGTIRYIMRWPGDRGEPETMSCIMPDGSYLAEIETDCCFSDDGRYFVMHYGSELRIFERQQKALYKVILDKHPSDLIKCQNGHIYFRNAKLALSEVLEEFSPVLLVAVADLWIIPAWAQGVQKTHIVWPAGPTGQRREGHLFLPANLRHLPDPLIPLEHLRYQLWLDGIPGDVVLAEDEVILAASTSQALACKGWSLKALQDNPESWEENPRHYWRWHPASGWREIKAAIAEMGRLPLRWGKIEEISGRKLWVGVTINNVLPFEGRYGAYLRDALGTTFTGYDRAGRLLPAELAEHSFEVLLPVIPGRQQLRSIPLPDGRRLIFIEFSRDKTQVAYQVWFGDYLIPGLWQLEYRIDDEKEHVALLPACAASALCDNVVVFKFKTKCLFSSPPMLIGRLHSFSAGILSVIDLAGLLSEGYKSHPLQPADLPPPPASRAAKFYTESWKYPAGHHLLCLRIDTAGLVFLPDWRVVQIPQVANAGGDFILPAPEALDAAWLRGAVIEGYWMDQSLPRKNGYLLTASGCAIYGVTPSFAWCDQGRYLALTHLLSWNDPDNDDPQRRNQWQLWLLDTHERTLRIRAGSTGRMPAFDRFSKGHWGVCTFDTDYERQGEIGRYGKVSLASLLQLPAEALIRRGQFFHRAEEEQPDAHWQTFDDQILNRWRYHEHTLL